MYVYQFSEGDKTMFDLLGGKGANLAEMTKMGIPVPPGFTISTEACRFYLSNGEEPAELEDQVAAAVTKVEEEVGRKLGDPSDPLLLSVRSGARFSMPGMMETVLNIGLNDESVVGLAETSGHPRFAWDSYRRLIQMFGGTVLGIDTDLFEDVLEEARESAGVALDNELDVTSLQRLVEQWEIVFEQTGRDFPQDPREQLHLAILAVFDSWNTERARIYRRQERIPADLGTAVNVQTMVFGNAGEGSGTGVAFTRDPPPGAPGVYGDYLHDAQGEDVVAGIRNTLPLSALAETDEAAHDQLLDIMNQLEQHYQDLCDIEFTVERHKLWMLQTRVGKRTAGAAFRIAVQLVDEGLIDMDEAVRRVKGAQLANLMFPRFGSTADATLLAKGMGASPGAAVGGVVFDSATAVERAAAGEDVILVRRETNPDDLSGMVAAAGVLTSRGGKTSHAAVVARGMGKTAVCGAEALDIDVAGRQMTVGDRVISEVRSSPSMAPPVRSCSVRWPWSRARWLAYFDEGIDVALEHADDESAALVKAVDRIMQHADEVRRLRVRANADTPTDAARARRMGAEGIGLLRTEHMFLGERKQYVENADPGRHGGRAAGRVGGPASVAAQGFHPHSRSDGRTAGDDPADRPAAARVPARPHRTERPGGHHAGARRRRRGRGRAAVGGQPDGRAEPDAGSARRAARLGAARAVRVAGAGDRGGCLLPQADERRPAGGDHDPAGGFDPGARARYRGGAAGARRSLRGAGLFAGLPARHHDRVARGAHRRPDRAGRRVLQLRHQRPDPDHLGLQPRRRGGSLLLDPIEKGVFSVSPFESIDTEGVGRLVEIAVKEGHETRPDLHCGVCGEHGGDRRRCTSSTTLVWTTSPARRSGCRWLGWRPVVRRSAPAEHHALEPPAAPAWPGRSATSTPKQDVASRLATRLSPATSSASDPVRRVTWPCWHSPTRSTPRPRHHLHPDVV